MIMFCKSYQQLAGALWFTLYCMNNRHVIALLYHYALAIVVEAIVSEIMTTMEIKVSSW